MDHLAIAMKALTFAGVLAAATGMNLPSVGARQFRAHLALGAAGVALMFANAWLAASPAAILVDVAYAASCGVLLARCVLSGAARPDVVRFEVVEVAPG